MAYYFLAHYTVNDLPTFQAYAPPAVATVAQYGGRILAATGIGMGDAKAIEQTAQHTVTVVIEFDSEAALDRWYASAEYQALVGQRLGATDGWAVGLPGLASPA